MPFNRQFPDYCLSWPIAQQERHMAKILEMRKYQIFYDHNTRMWNAWSECGADIICSSPYPTVALNGHTWYCENILEQVG